jgi:hypothetical protein
MLPFEEIESRLRVLFNSMRDRLSADHLVELDELIRLHGEYALAVEFAADWISEDELPLLKDERAEMLDLARIVRTDRVSHAIADVPTTAQE